MAAVRQRTAREPRVSKLDPYKAYLRECIEQARPDWILPTVLMREIGAMGYAGGISQLKSYPHAFKVVRADPVCGFGLHDDPSGRDRLLALVATLGFSRSALMRFTRSELFADWRGGLPREVFFDNTKTVIMNVTGTGQGYTDGMRACSSSPATAAFSRACFAILLQRRQPRDEFLVSALHRLT